MKMINKSHFTQTYEINDDARGLGLESVREVRDTRNCTLYDTYIRTHPYIHTYGYDT